ncbi:MAG: radical SAM protein [Vicinamibacterales bacterium]
MADTAPLFDLGPRRPTTQTIALLVRDGGSDALPSAIRRADAARYQEVTCRSALNPVKGMAFNWTLNPYRGCTHACHYCFARRYQTQFELGADDEFSSVIFVKVNFADVLARELDKPSWTREVVALGTATDPYQPIEGHYKLTRRSLEALGRARTPVGLVTKGPMVVRDKDVLVEVSKHASCTVCLSVPSVDEEAWERMEPGTAHPLQRLRAVRELCEAGVRAGVLMAPIVPGISSQPAKLERTIKAIADHGAAFVGANVLHLEGGTREHFMKFLAAEYPDLVDGYDRLYAGKKYAPKRYAAEVRKVIGALQSKYGLSRRAEQDEDEKTPDLATDPEQAKLW